MGFFRSYSDGQCNNYKMDGNLNVVRCFRHLNTGLRIGYEMFFTYTRV